METVQGGFVHLPGGEKFEYLLAEFGVKVPSGGLMLDGSPDPPGSYVGRVAADTRGDRSHFRRFFIPTKCMVSTATHLPVFPLPNV